MFEVHLRTRHGWQPLSCNCPAGRAVFSSEEHAQAAVVNHLFSCAGGTPSTGASGGAYRLFSAELAPTA